MSGMVAARDDASGSTDGLSWQRSYDRASVERYLAEAEARSTQLRAQVAEAQQRVERARAALAKREAARSAELAAMVADAHRQLAALEADHAAAVEATHAAAQAHTDRILSEARGHRTLSDDGEPT